jgi:ATP-dependent DNA helicase UvrD/PcrA
MPSSFDELTPEQRAVADHPAPTLLVLGGAGVGKTTTALWAARRELTNGGVSKTPVAGRRVLFVTFSRTAVAQIRSRAGGVLTDIGGSVEILTFHGLAYRMVCAFGQYLGYQHIPTLVGEARSKLGLGATAGQRALTYDHLLPLALRLLETPGPISELMRSRWSLVICDEFQDTDDQEWRLLQILGLGSRLLLLADPNQMIFGFKKGVSELRLDAAREREGCVEVTLPPGSHRDSTQVIPDAAAAIRWRRFDDPSVARAFQSGRLIVLTDISDDDDDRAVVIADQVRQLRAAGHATVGIYAKRNSDAAGYQPH